MLLVSNLTNTKRCKKLESDWNPGIWILFSEYSAKAVQWIPKWQGLYGFQKSLRPLFESLRECRSPWYGMFGPIKPMKVLNFGINQKLNKIFEGELSVSFWSTFRPLFESSLSIGRNKPRTFWLIHWSIHSRVLNDICDLYQGYCNALTRNHNGQNMFELFSSINETLTRGLTSRTVLTMAAIWTISGSYMSAMYENRLKCRKGIG